MFVAVWLNVKFEKVVGPDVFGENGDENGWATLTALGVSEVPGGL